MSQPEGPPTPATLATPAALSTPAAGSGAELSPLQRAVVAMKEMRRRIDELEAARSQPIAVIGVGCRFPGGADSPEAFWRLLSDRVDAVREVPAERWDIDAYYDPDPDHYGTMTTRYGGFLEGIDRFDPHFFGISAHEATSIDPQHRLLLEVTWEALERACIPPSTLSESRTGVFVGITAIEYVHLLMRARAVNAYYVAGSPLCAAAGRLSHLLGLQGPCMSIDTACSSALVSLHQACQSLRSGECDIAIAGGVNLTLTPEGSVFLSRARMLAPNGRCKAFDASADGFVRGEGCGVVVLKRLDGAEAAGDPIRAVILGSAVNHDGPSNGFTAPNGRSQERLIRQALATAGVEATEVDLVETHGTGTGLGDPIEAAALGAALCRERPADRPLYLGAVKTNLGHLESASGAAGLIKTVLALEHGLIPANLHFTEPSPHIPWDQLPIQVPTGPVEWPANGRRIAGVSAFGATGTNAHVIVTAAPARQAAGTQHDRPHLLVLSARSPGALSELAGRYADHLVEHPAQPLVDVCFSAATCRDHFEHRLAVVAGSGPEAAEMLAAFARDEKPAAVLVGALERCHAPNAGLGSQRGRLDGLPAAGSEAGDGSWAESLGGMARSYVLGDEVDLAAAFEELECRKAVLPTSPFQRMRCWPDIGPYPGPEVEAPAGTTLADQPCSAPVSLPGPRPEPVMTDIERYLGWQLETVGATLARVIDRQLEALAGQEPIADDQALGAREDRPLIQPVHDPSRQAMARPRRVSIGDWHLLMLAASSEEALQAKSEELAEAITSRAEVALEPDAGRPTPATFAHRKVVVFRDPADAAATLLEPTRMPRRCATGTWDGRPRSVAFMLPGLGDQYPGMARGLYRSAQGFRRRLDRCAALLEPELGADLREILFPDSDPGPSAGATAIDLRQMLGRGEPAADEASRRLNRLSHAHSAIFSVEYALAGLWQDWGVRPQALLGFSLGELVAATIAGVMSLEDGLRLVARRARLIEALEPGAMLAVPLGLDELTPLLEGGLSVAVRCAPTVQVVAGAPDAIEDLQRRMAERETVSRRLQSGFAFHSAAMAPQEAPVTELAGQLRLRPPAIPICSNTTGTWLAPDEATDPGYWARHTVQPVRFGDGVERLLETDRQVLIEVGPGQSLTSFALQSPARQRVSSVELVPTLRSRHETDDDEAMLLLSLGRLWLNGIEASPREPRQCSAEDRTATRTADTALAPARPPIPGNLVTGMRAET